MQDAEKARQLRSHLKSILNVAQRLRLRLCHRLRPRWMSCLSILTRACGCRAGVLILCQLKQRPFRTRSPEDHLCQQDVSPDIRLADSWIDCRTRSLSRWVALDGVMDKRTGLQ